MPTIIRALLVVGAIFVFHMVTTRIRKKKILMQDAIYWVILALLLVLAAIFPGAIIWVAEKLHFLSPSNFVFLLIIALLLVKVFSNSCEISLLRHKVEELAQESALADKDER